MKFAIVINNESMGKGDDELGKKLMGAFLRKLWVQTELPDMIVFYNSGVKLISSSSTVLDVLHGLYEKGVDIIACGTCLDHFDLGNDVKVGRRSDMVEIVSVITGYDKVVTI